MSICTITKDRLSILPIAISEKYTVHESTLVQHADFLSYTRRNIWWRNRQCVFIDEHRNSRCCGEKIPANFMCYSINKSAPFCLELLERCGQRFSNYTSGWKTRINKDETMAYRRWKWPWSRWKSSWYENKKSRTQKKSSNSLKQMMNQALPMLIPHLGPNKFIRI